MSGRFGCGRKGQQVGKALVFLGERLDLGGQGLVLPMQKFVGFL